MRNYVLLEYIILFIKIFRIIKCIIQLYKHTLGTPASSDILLYEEQDDRFFVDVTKTKDMVKISILSCSYLTNYRNI